MANSVSNDKADPKKPVQRSNSGFGGGIPGLNADYQKYQTGADLNFNTDLWRSIEDQYGTRLNKQFDQVRADQADRFQNALMPSSISALAAGQIEQGYGDAYANALNEAFLGMRAQNMGMTSDFGNMEASNLGSQRGLQGAQAAASASRYGADKSYGAAMAGINAQREQNAWNNMFDLANLQYQDEMAQWNYGTNFEGNQLDQFLNRSLPIGNAGSTTTQPYDGTNPLVQLGNTMTGAGMIAYGNKQDRQG